MSGRQLAVQAALAAFPGLDAFTAASLVARGAVEPLWGALGMDHLQVCPQQRGQLTPELAAYLAAAFPDTRFRLHANVQVLPRRRVLDLCQFSGSDPYWQALARVSRTLGAPAYSAHAGQRAHGSVAGVIENTRRAADLFECPVAVEGHYPDPRGAGFFLIDSWEEYRAVLDADVAFALDLSHINIVAHRSGQRELGLLADLMAAPHCIEIHVSGNDGRRDAHEALDIAPWWHPLLSQANPAAVVFSEGKLPQH